MHRCLKYYFTFLCVIVCVLLTKSVLSENIQLGTVSKKINALDLILKQIKVNKTNYYDIMNPG